MNLKEVTVYTDGACLGNPGPGGYGVIIERDGTREEKCGGYRLTTNNRMEIMAAIVGLEAAGRGCRVTLFSDSQYLVRAINEGWARRWKAKGWMRTAREPALNPDLWEKLLTLCDSRQVEFRWVRGHSSHRLNERCDRLAGESAKGADLPVDSGYERLSKKVADVSLGRNKIR